MFRLVSSQIFGLNGIKIAKFIPPFYLGPLNRFYLSDNSQKEQNLLNKQSQPQTIQAKKTKFIIITKQQLEELIQKHYDNLKKQINYQKKFHWIIVGVLILQAAILGLFYLNIINRDKRAKQQFKQIVRKQKQEIIRKYSQDQEKVKGLDDQISNYQLQEQFLKIISSEERHQKTKVKVFSGISGIGKTTTLKKIIRQMRKKEEYKDKVFYISLEFDNQNSQKSGKPPTNALNLNTESPIQRKIQELNIIQYQVVYEKYGKDSKDKMKQIIDKNTNKKKYIAPIIFIDNINKLQRIMDPQKIINFFQYLHSLSKEKVQIFAISSSISFSQYYSKRKELTKARLCFFEQLNPLKGETIKNILKAITDRHLEMNKMNKSYFQGSNAAFKAKVEQFVINKSGFLPQQAETSLIRAFTNIEKKFSDLKNKQDIYEVLLSELETYRSNQMKEQVKDGLCLFQNTQLYKNKRQILKNIFNQICKLQTNNYNKSNCLQITKRIVSQSGNKISDFKVQDIYRLGQKGNLTCSCYPRSKFMQEVLSKIRDRLDESQN